MAYRAVLASRCSRHGGHEVVIYSKDDLAILFGLDARDRMEQDGIDCSVTFFDGEDRMTDKQIIALMVRGMEEHADV